jgi:hypothetical protein
MCEVLAQLNEGTFDETKAAANAQLPDKKPGTTATPIWTCYIASSGLKDISNLAWDSSPCGAVAYDGTVWHMTPDLAGSNRVDGMTTDGTNKTAVTGEEAYVDGIWTMERFIQYQTALWNAEEAVVAELNSEIATRAFSKTRTLNNQEGCVILNPAETVCEIGEFVSQFSPHYFGFNACSFWLTRFALETKEYATHSKTTRQCNDPGPSQLAHVGYVKISGGVRGSTVYGSPEAAMFSDGLPTDELRPELVTSLSVAGTIGYAKTHAIWCASCSPAQMYDTNWVEAKYVCTDGKTIVSSVDGANGTPPTVYEQYIAGHVDLIDTSYANNQVAATNAGVLGVETAWCEITGWQYTNNAGETVTAAATSCTDMGNNYPGSADPTAAVARTANPAASYPLLIDAQGIVCDVEFVPAINGDVSWPSQDLTYAGLTFLLQDGSISPKYPTIYGAYVYDLHLKKWGKYKGPYKGLLDYSPVNSESSSVISSNNFGILAGAWKDDGFIYLFDDRPVDSELTWGKVGYYRRGMSDIQEVKFNFKTKATGSISVDLSLDGRAISEPSNFEETHTDVYNKTVYPPYSGKWFNVTIKGQYDVSGLTIVGGRKGQR